MGEHKGTLYEKTSANPCYSNEGLNGAMMKLGRKLQWTILKQTAGALVALIVMVAVHEK